MEIDKNIKSQQLRRKSSIVYAEVKNIPMSSDSDNPKIKEMSFGESDKDIKKEIRQDDQPLKRRDRVDSLKNAKFLHKNLF